MRKENRIAVVFPGIGYHTDKPLLYYAKRLAQSEGYQIREVPYKGFHGNIKGSSEKMEEAFQMALGQTEELLKDLEFDRCDEVLFISKSIGTVIAEAYAGRHHLQIRHILFTPLEATFRYIPSPEGRIAFHGTADQWADTGEVRRLAEEKRIPLYITENANHSLETDDVLLNIRNLEIIMRHVHDFIA